MKKKIISLVLVCALLITILPSGVSALSKVNPSEKKEVSLKKGVCLPFAFCARFWISR